MAHENDIIAHSTGAYGTASPSLAVKLLRRQRALSGKRKPAPQSTAPVSRGKAQTLRVKRTGPEPAPSSPDA